MKLKNIRARIGTLDLHNNSLQDHNKPLGNHTMEEITKRDTEMVLGGIGIAVFFLHAVIITLVLSCRDLRTNHSIRLLLNLCIGHMLTGLVYFLGIALNMEISVLLYITYIWAVLALLMLTLDRYIFIKWPFKYKIMHSSLHWIKFLLSPVISGIALVRRAQAGFFNNVFEEETSIKTSIYGLGAIMLTLFVINLSLLCLLRRQQRRIKPQVTNRITVTDRRKGILTFYICLGCTITFILLWLPYLTYSILRVYFGIRPEYFAIQMVMITICLNPISDAIIFVWYNKPVKDSLRKLFKKLWNRINYS